MARKFTQRKSFTQINEMSERELRKEYSALRDILHKRVGRSRTAGLDRLSEFDTGGYREIPYLSVMKERLSYMSPGEFTERLRSEVKDLTNIIFGVPGQDVYYSLSAVKKERKKELTDIERMISTFHKKEHGQHIQKSTLKNFGRFMEAMRKQYGRKLPQSEEALEFFNSLKYNTKKRSTEFIMDLWREYEKNGYEPDYGSTDFFST